MNSMRRKIAAKCVTLKEAVQMVQSGDRVYLGIASSTANALCDALRERGNELEGVTLCTLQALGDSKILTEMDPHAFQVETGFMGPWEREARKKGRVDYTSVHLSQVDIWCEKTAKPDIAFLEVSLPDQDGFMCYGASGIGVGEYIKNAAERIILQINPNVPYIYGAHNLIHYSEAAVLTEAASPIPEVCSGEIDEATQKISDFLLDQIPDGACLQLGIGSLSNAIGYGLKNKNDLGIHTEMMTNSMMELLQLGCVTNSRKTFMPGKSVCVFALGTRALYRFIDHNADLYFAPFPVVNAPETIAKNKDMISVNTAISVDLFGQVNADNFCGRQYSSTGGQLDFVRGAQMSQGGKSFIALNALAGNPETGGQSKIVCRFPAGTAVTTPRSDVQYVVTEYGCVNLKELSMRGRVRAMISLAHPDFRGPLEEEARAAGMI